jgi:hypothetical protein
MGEVFLADDTSLHPESPDVGPAVYGLAAQLLGRHIRQRPQRAVGLGQCRHYAMAGDRAPALDWLEKANADRDPNMPFIGCNPVFDVVRAEPRFQALLRAMNLSQ